MRRSGAVGAAVVLGLVISACGGSGTSYQAVREAVVASNDRTVIVQANWSDCQPQPHLVLRPRSKVVQAALAFPPARSGNCTAVGYDGSITAALPSSFGHRRLLQLTTGKAVPTIRQAALPRPRVLPPGYRLQTVEATVAGAGLAVGALGSTRTYHDSARSSPDLVLVDLAGDHLPVSIPDWQRSRVDVGGRQGWLFVLNQPDHIVTRAVAWSAFGQTLELVADDQPGEQPLPAGTLVATARAVQP